MARRRKFQCATLSLIVALQLLSVVGAQPAFASSGTYSTTRHSVSSGGAEANQRSWVGGTTAGSTYDSLPQISADARYVVFTSAASNLVSGDTNNARDVFLRDRISGQTTRISLSGSGAQANAPSSEPTISGDGRYVAFVSQATNLVDGDTNGLQDVFVRDLQTGTTIRASISSTGVEANHIGGYPAISGDGRYVAFTSFASNLIALDTNGDMDVFVRDTATSTTTRISESSAGSQGNGNSLYPSISADGRYVAFSSLATNLVTSDLNGHQDVFLRDRETSTTTRVSVNALGIGGNGVSENPAISADGRIVAFESEANDLVVGDVNGARDVFVRDLTASSTERVSVSDTEGEANGESLTPAISSDGRYVAFDSLATNLVLGDTNGTRDVLVRDRTLGTTTRPSVATGGGQAAGSSQHASISADGHTMVFDSLAANLISDDTNSWQDVFVSEELVPTVGTAPIALAGGPLHVFVHDDSDPRGTRTIATGSFPANGQLSVALPLTALLNRSSDQISLRGLEPFDQQDSTALMGFASFGLDDASIEAVASLSFGDISTGMADLYEDPDVAYAASLCSTCSTEGSGPFQWPSSSGTPDTAAPDTAGLQPALEETGSDLGGSQTLPSQGCSATNTCAGPGVIVSQLTVPVGDTCTAGPDVTTCIVSERDTHGVLAFRGWSNRWQTIKSRFKFYTQSEQTWQNGGRLKTGPFTMSGSTTRTNTTSGTDTWPLRDDCYVAPNEAHSTAGCTSYDPIEDGMGHLAMWGRDTWRWFKELNVICHEGFCTTVTSEHVHQKSTDGGTESGNELRLEVNYRKKPKRIENDEFGAWVRYQPGSTRETSLAESWEYTNAAEFSVNFPESYGNAAVTSTMISEATDKQTNTWTARSLPWMKDPLSGNLKGWTYRYDMNQDWKDEYFSCMFATGWISDPAAGTDYCWPRDTTIT